MAQLKNLPIRNCSLVICGKETNSYIVIREGKIGIAEVVICADCLEERLARRK